MNLELAILAVLETIHPRMERQSVIVAEVKNSSVKTPTTSDVERKLASLEEKKNIVGVSNEDTGNKWKITDSGIARWVEYNS